MPLGKKSLREAQDITRQGLSHYQSLEADLKTTLDGIRRGTIDLEDTINQLQAIEKHVEAVGRYLSSQIEPSYYNEIRPSDSTIAERVLTIPEILELILLNANITSIVAVELASKSIRNIIYGSPKLQIKGGLKPLQPPENQPPKHHSPLKTWELWRTGVDVTPNHPGCFVEIARQKGGGAPSFCTRWQRMLICQPPVKLMRAMRRCNICWLYEWEENGQLGEWCDLGSSSHKGTGDVRP